MPLQLVSDYTKLRLGLVVKSVFQLALQPVLSKVLLGANGSHPISFNVMCWRMVVFTSEVLTDGVCGQRPECCQHRS